MYFPHLEFRHLRVLFLRQIEKNGFKINSTWDLVHQDHKHEEESLEQEDLEHEHNQDHGEKEGWKAYIPVGISFFMLLIGIIIDNYIRISFFNGWIRFAWYLIAYLPVGWPVAKRGITYALKGDVFTEFVLMTIATVGAFFIGEYPEGVAVMLFYTVGELFQDAAVNRAKRSVKALLDIIPANAVSPLFRD